MFSHITFDTVSQNIVRQNFQIRQGLVCHRAASFLTEPTTNSPAFVIVAIGSGDGVLHDLVCDWAKEFKWNRFVELIVLCGSWRHHANLRTG